MFTLIYDKTTIRQEENLLNQDYLNANQFIVKRYEDLGFVQLPFINKPLVIPDITAALLACFGLKDTSGFVLHECVITWWHEETPDSQSWTAVFLRKKTTAQSDDQLTPAEPTSSFFSILFRPLDALSYDTLPACCIVRRGKTTVSSNEEMDSIMPYASYMWRKRTVVWKSISPSSPAITAIKREETAKEEILTKEEIGRK